MRDNNEKLTTEQSRYQKPVHRLQAEFAVTFYLADGPERVKNSIIMSPQV